MLHCVPSRKTGPALCAAILLFTPNLFAHAVTQVGTPLVSADAQHFATLWRGVSLALDQNHCVSIECVDLSAKLRTIGVSFEQGGSSAALFASLKATWRSFDAVLKRDLAKDYARGHADGAALFANAKATVVGGPQENSSLGDCEHRCDAVMVMVLAVCSVLPPPLNVLCVGTAIVAYINCLEQCDGTSGWGMDAVPATRLSMPDPVTATQLRSAAPRLLLRFSATELGAAVNFLTAQQEGAQ